ncbi:septin-1 isoform X1 [Harpegnathos saltator]|uniref:septin-1 isoform X1 n=1 Tax=Harpegnathos saltator TaxID=610380 RepID=UPI000DBEE37B|nr:septin-1 isoform X1 [Harpegnathos saltator]XP_025152729.1 septin-1 isoform X1 [Harpegnathos saltator]
MSSESVKTFASLETPGYVGFANLPNQVHRKSVKKGFEFTLMVVGESGLGKSTLVNSLFLTDLYPERVIPDAVEKTNQTVKLDASTVEIEERGVKLRLTVVDTPGYGDAIDNTDSFRAIIQYIDDQFERFLRDESGLNRRNIVDNRIHCCFYFISPFGHGLKPLDIEFMKQLHNKVNIVPVIAKADVLTKKEVLRLKKRVMEEIEGNGIKIYPLPDCDSDEDEDYKEQVRQLKEAVPFAVCGANTLLEVKGKRVRGRLYPWGVVEVENPDHCDFIKLRTMLIVRKQDQIFRIILKICKIEKNTKYRNCRVLSYPLHNNTIRLAKCRFFYVNEKRFFHTKQTFYSVIFCPLNSITFCHLFGSFMIPEENFIGEKLIQVLLDDLIRIEFFPYKEFCKE